MRSSSLTAVIVAGGKGSRMGAAIPKQFLSLGGQPLIAYALQAFLNCFPDIQVILVVPEEQFHLAQSCLGLFPEAEGQIIIAAGGETRFHSVQNGLMLVEEPGLVFVHDGVRPFADEALIRRCYALALEKGSAVPALPVSDSIRRWDGSKYAVVDRDELRALQTPQTFKTELLLPAYQQAYKAIFTDEATVVEAAGGAIHLTEGSKTNIKITTPEDMIWAESYLAERNK